MNKTKREIEYDLELANGCLCLIAGTISDLGEDVSQTPPMCLNDAVATLVLRERDDHAAAIDAKDAEIERLKGVVGNQHKTIFAKSDRITEKDRRIAELEADNENLKHFRIHGSLPEGYTARLADLRAELAVAERSEK